MSIEKEQVWIVWGDSASVRDAGESAITMYEFDTLAEMNAFLLGIQEGCGTSDFTQADTEEEALEIVNRGTGGGE